MYHKNKDFRRIKEILKKINAKFILILCHHNADPDAVCSSFALSKLLKYFKPDIEVEIASPESVSKLSKTLLERFHIEVTNDKPSFNRADAIFMVDTNTVQQLGEWSECVVKASSPIIVVDHHAPHPETERIATLCICYEDASSTCEIIYNLFREASSSISRDVAEALFLGAAYDTKHFILANASTFKMIANLVDLGVNIQETMQLLSTPMDISERIARLKACERMKFMRIYGWLIVLSHVGSFQASAARALVDVGANLAIVGSQEKNKISISMRSDHEFHAETGIHLGRDLAKSLGEYLNGMGGGHSTSAGVNGTGDLELAFKYVTRLLREKLRHKPRR